MKLDVFFDGAFVGTAVSEQSADKLIVEHLGTWAGNGVPARIMGSRPVASLQAMGRIVEVESRRGPTYIIHTYRISNSLDVDD